MRKIWILIAFVLIVHMIAKKTVQKPLVDLLKLQVEKAWNSGLISLGKKGIEHPNTLFFLLDGNCSICEKWQQRLNTINYEMNRLRIVMLYPKEKKESDKIKLTSTQGILFQYIKPIVFRLLTGRIPMAVLVKNGMIKETWVGTFPENVFRIHNIPI